MTALFRRYVLHFPEVFPNGGFQSLKLVINLLILRNDVFENILLAVLP